MPIRVVRFIIVVFSLIIMACTWSFTRKFVPIDDKSDEPIAGWTFKPDIQSYHYTSGRGAPIDSGGVWLNLTAYHPRVKEGDILYGLDIDTVFMTFGKSNKVRHTWVRHSAAYGDPLEYRRFARRFRFQNPSGKYHFFVPDDVDTLEIIFDVRFYKGIMKSSKPNTEYSTQNDTVIVDTANPEEFRRQIRVKLIKTISRTMVPSII